MSFAAVLQAGVITDLVLLWTVGIRPVLVHGGGPEINSWLQKLNIEPEFKGGLRVTDGESSLPTHDHRQLVLAGALRIFAGCRSSTLSQSSRATCE
jgi:acetylglutamate kinase